MKSKIKVQQIRFAFSSFILIIVLIYMGTQLYNSRTRVPLSRVKIFRVKEPALISEDLPHKEYKRLQDSIHTLKEIQNGIKVSDYNFGFIGVQVNNICDNCNPPALTYKKEYLIRLNWWTIKLDLPPNYTSFYVKNGQSYLRKNLCKQEGPKNKYGFQDFYCESKDEAVPFRYDNHTNSLLIPVSESVHQLLTPFIRNGGSLFMGVFLFYVLFLFLRVMQEISGGTPFSLQNIKRLRNIAIGFAAYPVFVFLLNLTFRLIYSKYFTNDIGLSFKIGSFLWEPLAASNIFAVFYFALKRGRKLQDEIDLTV